jgi:Fe-S cluster assembly protein SufD
MTRVLEGKELFLANFKDARARLPGAKLPWLDKRRAEAIDRFAASGFPTAEDEEWRFTPVAPIEKTPFVLADKVTPLKMETLAGLALCPFGFDRMVFINGRHSPELSGPQSLPDGARLTTIAAVLDKEPARLEPWLAKLGEAEGRPFGAINLALFRDGALLLLPKGCRLQKPIHLIFVSSAPEIATMSHARALVVAEDGAQATVVEEYVGLDRGVCFTNVVSEVVVGENAGVSYYRLQRESDQTLHVSTLQARVERNGRFASHAVSLGGQLVRNDVNVKLAGEGADVTLNGLYLVRGRQHLDNHTLIEHAVPHGTSRQLYKGVLDGESRAVFNGSIIVQPNAQKTDAQVYNKNLLLSEHGMINTKPDFKIHANDVQCKHGATIGQMSTDAMFYLRSRGLGEEEARRLLVHAFASEMVERIEVETLREALSEALHQRLPEAA